MHNNTTLSLLMYFNKIDYALYYFGCMQIIMISIMERNLNFVHYPHYIDTTIFKNYGLPKKFDIILYGCVNSNVYPFRSRLFRLIYSYKKFKILFIPFPGYDIRGKRNIITGKKLAQLINQSYIGIVTSSLADYFLKKYIEIPASYAMIAGNLPSRDNEILKGNIIELSALMSNREIIQRLETALRDKEELMRRIDKLHHLIINKYSFDNGYENLMDFVKST